MEDLRFEKRRWLAGIPCYEIPGATPTVVIFLSSSTTINTITPPLRLSHLRTSAMQLQVTTKGT